MAPPLLLLYGIDERSRDFEITSTIALVRAVSEALLARGWRLLPLQVTHDLVLPLKPFRPDEWLVFNLCEGEPGQAFYYARAPASCRSWAMRSPARMPGRWTRRSLSGG